MGDFNRSRRNSGRFGADDNRSFGGGRKFDKPRRRETEMHKVVCDKCGVDCEVPFKPTAGKPVLCSDCFKKEGGGRKGDSSVDLTPILEKLDKIIAILKIGERCDCSAEEKPKKAPAKKKATEVKKKVAVKKTKK